MSWTIRRPHCGEGHRLRELRLAALHSEPSAFLEDYSDAHALGPAEWEKRIARCSTPDRQILVIAENAGGEWVGMAGGFAGEERDDDSFQPPNPPVTAAERWAMVWGMYIRPAARSRGLADQLMYELRAWAADEAGVDWLTLDVADTNPRAIGLYRRHGFRTTAAHRPHPAHPDSSLIVMVRPMSEPVTGPSIAALPG